MKFRINVRQLNYLLFSGGLIAGLWLLISSCQPSKNVDVGHDAKWRADSVLLTQILDSLHKKAKVDMDYSNYIPKLSRFNSVEVFRNHTYQANQYFGFALKLTEGHYNDPWRRKTALHLLARFQELADSSGFQIQKIWGRYFLARFYHDNLNSAVSLPLFLETLADFEAIGDSIGIGIVSKRIGYNFFSFAQDYQTAIPFFKRAIVYTHDSFEIEANAAKLFECYLYLGKSDSAKSYLVYVKRPTLIILLKAKYHANQYVKGKSQDDSLNYYLSRFDQLIKASSNEAFF